MRFLFIHQNFPAQYIHVAQHLVSLGHEVSFITQSQRNDHASIRKILYTPSSRGSGCHPFVNQFDSCVRNGEAVARVCDRLSRERGRPDLVIGHNGWGELLYVKDVLGEVPLLGYFEFFYRFANSDVTFDPEFPPNERDAMRVRTLNAINLLGLEAVDRGQTPTTWQRSLYPASYQPKISVVHEGIDTGRVRPDPSAKLLLRNGLCLSRDDEVVTFSSRNLEPYRGFHVFMRALPELMRRRPKLQAIIVGGSGVSYGRRHLSGSTYREVMLDEVSGQIDLSRIHFVGKLPFAQYLSVLQVSTVHVYMTYPFVLSWSLLEAMATGCVVVCSRTSPAEEVIEDGANGLLFEFFDTVRLVETLEEVLSDRRAYESIRRAARNTIVKRYDLRTVCLPNQLKLIRDTAAQSGTKLSTTSIGLN
jgi:glycosyltransferase involved in cell wall biosynthesis